MYTYNIVNVYQYKFFPEPLAAYYIISISAIECVVRAELNFWTLLVIRIKKKLIEPNYISRCSVVTIHTVLMVNNLHCT